MIWAIGVTAFFAACVFVALFVGVSRENYWLRQEIRAHKLVRGTMRKHIELLQEDLGLVYLERRMFTEPTDGEAAASGRPYDFTVSSQHPCPCQHGVGYHDARGCHRTGCDCRLDEHGEAVGP